MYVTHIATLSACKQCKTDKLAHSRAHTHTDSHAWSTKRERKNKQTTIYVCCFILHQSIDRLFNSNKSNNTIIQHQHHHHHQQQLHFCLSIHSSIYIYSLFFSFTVCMLPFFVLILILLLLLSRNVFTFANIKVFLLTKRNREVEWDRKCRRKNAHCQIDFRKVKQHTQQQRQQQHQQQQKEFSSFISICVQFRW